MVELLLGWCFDKNDNLKQLSLTILVFKVKDSLVFHRLSKHLREITETYKSDYNYEKTRNTVLMCTPKIVLNSMLYFFESHTIPDFIKRSCRAFTFVEFCIIFQLHLISMFLNNIVKYFSFPFLSMEN